ncbi:MAG: YutD family protein [Lactobacillus sp.]|nr:YutD family protein [Lactobacillus sp.]
MVEKTNSNKPQENKFKQEQPLRHPLAAVALDNDQLKINKQLYQVIINKDDALDLELMRQKYDPYLDQYDFIVGDLSSDHLRLKGFYQDNAQAAIDRKKQTIADYLLEYCNPGGPYFVLQLLSPVHHYHYNKRKRRKNSFKNKAQGLHRKKLNKSFKSYHVRPSRIKRPETVAVKKQRANHHSFVIKKRKGSK